MSIPNTTASDGQSSSDDAPLDRLLTELETATDPYTVRQLWARALEHAGSVDDRDRVLNAAASRLPHLEVPDRGPSGTDRLWLRHVSREMVVRGGDLGNTLSATAQRVMRDVVFTAEADIGAWIEARSQNETILEFMRTSPGSAASLRELGRLAHRLRPIGVMALIDGDTTEALVAFNDAQSALPVASTGSVGEWMRVTRDDLRNWANSPDASHQLPVLIRRLIRETGNRVTSIHFPSGSGVTTGGWDGLVEADAASTYVPSGLSGWELSTEESSHAKANADFETRVGAISPEIRRTMTFVEVICRPWTKASEFREAAMARNEFADVRGYNVDDLDAWLEQAPATTVWFRELLHRSLNGIRTVGEVWRSWLASTTVPLDENVVLAGRARAVEEVNACVAAGAGISTVGGEVRLNEILSFFGAASQDSIDEVRGLMDLIVVDDEVAARQVFQTTIPLVLLVISPELATFLPPASRHRVFVAVPGGERVDITLPRLDSRAVTEHFRKSGADFHEASERGELARRSLLALRRKLAVHPELHRPSWAKGAASQEVRRVLLLQAWNRDREADRSAVERLLNVSYANAEEGLHALAHATDDPFVALVDDRWHVVSATDSWLLLSSQLTPTDISEFGGLAVDILTDIDPVLALSEEERWRASLDGVAPSFSSHIRRGVARTLALLGAVDLTGNSAVGRSGAGIARELVSRVLGIANQDHSFATWAAISPQLSLLVEAAPRAAVDGIREGLAADPPLMHLMFRDQEDSFLGSPRSSPHIQFLWALENLAWAPEFLADAIDLLAELASIDPGGKWSNRPIGSLKSVLCPWHPNTSATADHQIKVVQRLRTSHPEIAWEVVLSLLPNSLASHLLRRGPEYRNWKHAETRVLHDDYHAITLAASRALIEDAGSAVDRWLALIKQIDNIAAECQPDLRAALRGLASALKDPQDRRTIWEALRGFTSHHREYRDAKWALPESFLITLDAIVDLFEPQDPHLKFGWLFGPGRIELGNSRRRDDFAEYDAELAHRREDAVGEIFEGGGLEAILAFALSAAFPGQVGLALARHSSSDDCDDSLFEWLSGDSEAASSVAFAYFGERVRQRGWPYIESLLDVRSPRGSARLLRSTWEPIEAMARADALGGAVASEYWREFTYLGLGHDFDGVIEVAERLRAAGRNAGALHLLALYSRRSDSPEFAQAVAESLEGLMANPEAGPESSALSEYDFDLLMKVVARHRDDVGRDRAVRLEWYFLPALGFDPSAYTLHRTLAEDPAFFVQMIKLIYRPAHQPDEERAELTEADRRAAENAFHLLQAWHRCPGVNEAGELDERRLRKWIAEARRLLDEADRASVGDEEIGQALVAAPSDEVGWPPRPVRDIIQELRNDHLESGFARRIYNNRGVTSRSLDEGGLKEWNLVEKYRSMAEENRISWPRLERVFEGLAETYEAHARREDASAERRRRGLD